METFLDLMLDVLTRLDNIIISLDIKQDIATPPESTIISFDYGQKHRVELQRAQSLVDYVNANPNRVFVHEELPNGFISYPQVNGVATTTELLLRYSTTSAF